MQENETYPEVPAADEQLRVEALSQACRIAPGDTPKKITEVADVFYHFLRGR